MNDAEKIAAVKELIKADQAYMKSFYTSERTKTTWRKQQVALAKVLKIILGRMPTTGEIISVDA